MKITSTTRTFSKFYGLLGIGTIGHDPGVGSRSYLSSVSSIAIGAGVGSTS